MADGNLAMKILMSAYACEPNKGSEPGVGWGFAVEISKHHQVWVMTRTNNQSDIEVELAKTPHPNLHFIYHDLPKWARWWKRGSHGVQLYYYLWQLSAFQKGKALHQQIEFDLGHHLTFVKYWAPSFLAFIGIPYMFGPVGGGNETPWAFWKSLGFKGFLYELLRYLAKKIGEMDPLVRRTITKAKVCLATTKGSKKCLEKIGSRYVQVFSQVGLTNKEISKLRELKVDVKKPITFMSVGRLLALKGFHLGIEAFARAQINDAQYWVIGDGPQMFRLRSLAERLGVGKNVIFWGQLPHSATLKKIGAGHVLVHPSLHDSGGWVCVEAMALGKPVICLRLGGPNILIDDQTGIKIDAVSPEQSIRDIAQVMSILAKDNDMRASMGDAGLNRILQRFSWEKKGEKILELYKEISNL